MAEQEECKLRPTLNTQHVVLMFSAGSSDANEAIEISIVQAGNGLPHTISTFHPRFTYPIFGEEERIFGYQGLKIRLRWAAHDLRPNVQITYDKKFKAVGDTKADDIEEILKQWTPESELKEDQQELGRLRFGFCSIIQ